MASNLSARVDNVALEIGSATLLVGAAVTGANIVRSLTSALTTGQAHGTSFT